MSVKSGNRAVVKPADQTEQPSDAELARLIAQGDRNAAGVLVARYQAPVRGFLLKLSGNPDVADDIAQETFLRVLKYAPRYDPQFKMITWLLTIARRLWLNHIRRKDNQTFNTSYEQMFQTTPGPQQLAQRTDQQVHLKELLAEAMTHLPESQQMIITLFHQQELSVNEVAKVMKMPKGTVKSHLHRARAILRTLLEPQMENMQS